MEDGLVEVVWDLDVPIGFLFEVFGEAGGAVCFAVDQEDGFRRLFDV